MSYQVLARKWRPKAFGEVVGQEHVLRALINALDNNRLHHAYLFTGTRGVGKTTLGRILAKSLNCDKGVTATPCGVCTACREIDEGRFVDLLEVDAASRTKVEDTRELLDNVQYAPSRGRFKVYLIDEVHMLSGHSFNALLKTLEEPPEHVKFILATTDPQKLPVTILSRCLKFNLKCIPVEQVVGHLSDVLSREQIKFENGALRELARAAGGSMRDALSLLDQAIAFGGGEVAEKEVRAMLGTLDAAELTGLLEALAAADGEGLLKAVDRLAQYGADFNGVLSALLSTLHRLALIQMVGPQNEDDDALADLAGRIGAEDVQLYYQIGVLGVKELPLVADPRSGFEMLLLRMLAFRPVEGAHAVRPAAPATAPRAASAPAGSRPSQAAAAILKEKGPADSQGATRQATPPSSAPPERSAPAPASAPGQAATPSTAAAAGGFSWDEAVKALAVSGVVRQLALNCIFVGREGNTLNLRIPASFSQMAAGSIVERLEKAVSEYLGQAVKLNVVAGEMTESTPAEKAAQRQAERMQQAAVDLAADPNVKQLQETFGAELDPRNIRLKSSE